MPLSRDEATIREGSVRAFYFRIFREDKHGIKTPVLLADISTLVLDYFLTSTEAAINSRTAQDVKNANNVVVTDVGEVKWTMQAADTAQVAALVAGKQEKHTAKFKWTLSDGMIGSVRQDFWIISETV